MMRSIIAAVLVASSWVSCVECSSQRDISEAPRGLESRTAEEAPDVQRESEAEVRREVLVEALNKHEGVTYAMPSRSVPGWFFRPETGLRGYLPEGDLQAWEAQFDCSRVKKPACNLNYEVKLSDVADTDAAFHRARELPELGFQIVKGRAPSLKAVRPVERATAVDVVYVRKPEDGDIWMSATLREPVHPEVARFLAQRRFETVAGFAVGLVALPYSVSAQRAAFAEEVEFAATFDLAEQRRDAAEDYLESNDFELVSKGSVEAKTSIWRHPSGWKVSLEGGESVYERFQVYFTASGDIGR